MATNFEFYKDKILELTSYDRGLAKQNGELVRCGDIDCPRCDFWKDCNRKQMLWLYEEHVERPKVTKRERAFLELVGSGWIARDSEGELYYYNQEPKKGSATWCGVPTKAHARIDNALCLYFEFIKWDEDEPRKVEDLLQLEVMEE